MTDFKGLHPNMSKAAARVRPFSCSMLVPVCRCPTQRDAGARSRQRFHGRMQQRREGRAHRMVLRQVHSSIVTYDVFSVTFNFLHDLPFLISSSTPLAGSSRNTSSCSASAKKQVESFARFVRRGKLFLKALVHLQVNWNLPFSASSGFAKSSTSSRKRMQLFSRQNGALFLCQSSSLHNFM